MTRSSFRTEHNGADHGRRHARAFAIALASGVLVVSTFVWAAPPGAPTSHQAGATAGSQGAARPASGQPVTESAHHHAEADENAPPEPINWWHGLIGSKAGVEPSLLWRSPDEPPPFLATGLNFAVLLIIAVRFGRKPLADALASRKKAIMEGIDQAQKMKADAERRLAEYQAKLDRIDDELERIRRDLREQGERDRERIVREANERRERLCKDAALLVEQELKQMQVDVLRETIAAAMQAARELVLAKLTPADQDRMAEAFLADIPQVALSGNAGTRRVGLARSERMTNEETIAARYAQAIFDLGVEAGNPQALADEIARFASAVGESSDLQSVAGSPLVDRAAVEAVVADVAGRLGLSQLAKNAIGLMARRRRLLLVALVAEELSRLADERAGVVRATVASAAPLSEPYCQRLVQALERAVGKKVLLERTIDPSLVAGVVTRIGDQVIDGSARARLAFIQSELLSTATS